jgi:hypothetical protein
VENLPAGSGPFAIEITARVKEKAAAGRFATSGFEITCQTGEVDKTNNTAQAVTFIGEYVYMPIVLK